MEHGMGVIADKMDQMSSDLGESLASLENSVEELKGTVRKGFAATFRGQMESNTKAARECYRSVSFESWGCSCSRVFQTKCSAHIVVCVSI